MTTWVDHAVVIGASVAGLVTARVLSDTFHRVTVLDRDTLPASAVPRGGVPQSRHTHGLLALGREALEELFPGFTHDLTDRGAAAGDLQAHGRWFHGGGMLRRGESGLIGLGVSRPLLEGYLRERVTALANVTVAEAVSVLDLTFDAGESRVTGVLVADRVTGAPQGRLDADLVVDAAGRTSRTPAWLEKRGYPAPKEEQVRVDVTYATRSFRRSPGDADGDVVIVFAATPESPYAAALVAQEGDRWIASVCGYHGERAPKELNGFIARMEQLSDPALVDVIRDAEPLDEGATYRFPGNRRLRYERLGRFPLGLLVVGDAMCSFDPVYGQGMTTAALEALVLRDCVTQGMTQLKPRFFSKAARLIDVPWTIAVGGALDLPGTVGKRTLQTRIVNAYLRRYLRAAHRDAGLAGDFLRVANLMARPESLMSPQRLVRVLGRPSPPPSGHILRAERSHNRCRVGE